MNLGKSIDPQKETLVLDRAWDWLQASHTCINARCDRERRKFCLVTGWRLVGA
ncbi:MAG: hypothetical protein H7Z11_10565 [Verrucomicrobia bacterium]|nr:hypothetical protein [Leptolyngbya sp. ES-bin-22]